MVHNLSLLKILYSVEISPPKKRKSTVKVLGFRTFSKKIWMFSFFFLDDLQFNFRRLQKEIQTISIFYWTISFLFSLDKLNLLSISQ